MTSGLDAGAGGGTGAAVGVATGGGVWAWPDRPAVSATTAAESRKVWRNTNRTPLADGPALSSVKTDTGRRAGRPERRRLFAGRQAVEIGPLLGPGRLPSRSVAQPPMSGLGMALASPSSAWAIRVNTANSAIRGGHHAAASGEVAPDADRFAAILFAKKSRNPVTAP